MHRFFLTIVFAALCCEAPAQTAEKTAQQFLRSLDTAQRSKTLFSWDDAERFNWHFVPRARKGLPLKEMNEAQRSAAYALLKRCMSNGGYAKATAIVQMEYVLRALEGRGENDDYRDPGKYYFSVFGEPVAGKPWGWRVEGHHLSLNFTAVENKWMTGSPMFLGSNPGIVPDGPKKGQQILKEETAMAFELLRGLNEQQRKEAVVAEKAPADIITGNKRKAWLQEPPGLGFPQFSAAQQKQLKMLVAVYVDRYTKLMADILWKEIADGGWENVHFAWAGGNSWGTGHYYRIQGPSFIIEYDNTQNNGNHVHTTFRDLKNDFGEDLLKEHYESAHSAKN
ncbi:DUF3500 domain-containing protein [Chitinophaga sp. GCM10012297]|uniref:DUF3500 domain-containing protein n=1 Tax=Chitinophaga chungangae TaxID=2821488 RepID=A0ABS3YEX2_9BACT|nr:DUF3500 domain-containing protein [Chitinophaga chungangae]MBO9152843.1 DUF3500 domain-containing protein [Chitinophaga chungangae]